jgi:hypothetical protein
MSSVFGFAYRREQLFGLIKDVKTCSRTRVIYEHLEGCMRTATQIKPDVDGLSKNKQCKYLISD